MLNCITSAVKIYTVYFVLFHPRKFLQDVIQDTLAEVNTSQTYTALTQAVNREREKKEQLQRTILK